ncbi:dihydroorotate dehydrogenase [Candidatus Peregrinibacteria bacterium]|nr:dihydroorotate dehydrogenase [Candidatus Peregrinibacteria bacterium]
MADLSVNFCGVKFKNPLVLASGILGITASSWRNVVRHGAGGITTKSLWLHEHKGHRNPVIIANEHYMLNAVGVPDAGVNKAREEIGKFLAFRTGAPLIANIIADTVHNFGETAAEIAKIKPDILEVNISCPNVEDEFGKPFACVAADAARVTKEVKSRLKKMRFKIPVIIKLSPNVENIVEIARAVVNAGADGLTVMNSVGPGMAINIETRTPILKNKVGGLTGPALKPLAVKFIYDIHHALPKTPIIGIGGVLTGADAIELMMAGATLVGIGTGIYYRGIGIFKKITDEMQTWCKANHVKRLSDLIGTVS